MEVSPISRRISWCCVGAVEVAPDWPLGLPPPYEFYFMRPHHLRLYIRAMHDHHDTSIHCISGLDWVLVMNRSGLYLLHAQYLDLFNRKCFTWDNFQYCGPTCNVYEYLNSESTYSLFYYKLYDTLIREYIYQL